MRSMAACAVVRLARRVVLIATLALAALGETRAADQPDWRSLRGACYCRAAEALHCTAGLTQPECRRRCAEELCDDWFWLERLPCWNWGYGG